MDTITIKDVAKMCGVGVSTVSRAINNHPDINPDTKEKILQFIKENNYIPNNSARNLKRTDSKSIAVLVKGITNPFFSAMIKVIEKEAKKKKYSLILHRVEFNEDEIDVALELVKEKRLRGFIFLGGYFAHTEEKLKQLPVPFVLGTTGMIGNIDNLEFYSCVSLDDEKESYRMVDYLCRTGHKRIAIICAQKNDCSIGKLRLDGYIRALTEHELPISEDLILRMRTDLEDYSLENGYETTKEFLRKKLEFDAIYAISDNMAIGACRALTEAGVRVPEDCSVCGFDGIPISNYYTPTITTIAQPSEEMAKQMTDTIFRMIGKKDTKRQVVVQGELLERESTMRRMAE